MYYEAHIVLLGNSLTLPVISDIVAKAQQLRQRSRFSYTISEDKTHIDEICQDAILILQRLVVNKTVKIC